MYIILLFFCKLLYLIFKLCNLLEDTSEREGRGGERVFFEGGGRVREPIE